LLSDRSLAQRAHSESPTTAMLSMVEASPLTAWDRRMTRSLILLSDRTIFRRWKLQQQLRDRCHHNYQGCNQFFNIHDPWKRRSANASYFFGKCERTKFWNISERDYHVSFRRNAVDPVRHWYYLHNFWSQHRHHNS